MGKFVPTCTNLRYNKIDASADRCENFLSKLLTQKQSQPQQIISFVKDLYAVRCTEVWLMQDQGVLVDLQLPFILQPIERYHPPEVILHPQPWKA